MLGVVTITGLSVEQYPFLAPPNIRVTATYPGASAEAVEQSVATPIEQEVNGVDRLIYMKSSNTSDGRMQLDVNFEVGTDQDIANVLTQNRVSAAQARLPQEVTQQGVTVKKQSPSILMVISIYSPTDAYDANFLINYAGINLRDQLLRIPGHRAGGSVRRHRLRHAHLVPARQAGQAGPDPGGRHQRRSRSRTCRRPPARSAPRPRRRTSSSPTRSAPRAAWSRRRSSRTSSCGRATTGAVVRIKDIGRAELGSQDYNAFGRLNGKPAGAMAVYLLPGANQLKAAETIYATMERAKALFPPGMDYKIVYDTTPAVEASIHEIMKTFVEALILVTLVVFIFLQNIRATIIPLITIPVSLIGTFIFFPMLGFLGQHAVDVRPGARHRHRGGRRHRRGRGGHPPPRARDESEGGDHQGDGGGDGAGHRHRAHPLARCSSRSPCSAGWSAACTSSSR